MRTTASRLIDAPPRELFRLTTCGPVVRTFRVFEKPCDPNHCTVDCDLDAMTIHLDPLAGVDNLMDVVKHVNEMGD